MKNILKFKVFTFLLILILAAAMPASAAGAEGAETPEARSAAALVRLQLMKGDERGSLNLQNKVTRAEFVTLIIRMLGYDKEGNYNDVKVDFKDITNKHWAYDNIKIAIKQKLLTGYTDKTVRPDNRVTFTEARAIIIRALGYEKALKGAWPGNVTAKAAELGLNRDLAIPDDREITRGEAAILMYNSLTVDFLK